MMQNARTFSNRRISPNQKFQKAHVRILKSNPNISQNNSIWRYTQFEIVWNSGCSTEKLWKLSFLWEFLVKVFLHYFSSEILPPHFVYDLGMIHLRRFIHKWGLPLKSHYKLHEDICYTMQHLHLDFCRKLFYGIYQSATLFEISFSGLAIRVILKT